MLFCESEILHAFVGVTCLVHACVVHAFVGTARVVHACAVHAHVVHVCVVHACVLLHTSGYSDLFLSLAESLDLWPGSRAVLQTTYATCLQSMTPSSLPVPLSTLCQRS